ncbi:hypothetical protein EAH87_00120 [Sphingomonas koreensis]|nr:hypothetical protein EAH87_00120 [Sphingomonas koreensis]
MPHEVRHAAAGQQNGSTLFERMRRGTQTQNPAADYVDIPRFLHHDTGSTREIVFVDVAAEHGANGVAGVRFVRGEADGSPAVIMEERGSGNVWQTTWSLPTESADAREGMIGWLNTQSDRWPRFARMFHRRSGEELTRWIFELMVIPTTAQAIAPRFQPQHRATVNHYAGPSLRDDCSCRPGSVQRSRDY